jgi:DNA-binding GntR family transcriptional regulator
MTKTDVALLALRERIGVGQLAPGDKLDASVLASELGMSVTPIREALRVLSADGLIEMQPHRGATVADTSALDEEVWQLRTLLEPRAVHLAVPRLVDGRLANLEETHELCLRLAKHPAEYEHNRLWHFAIYEVCGQPILVSFIRRLWDAVPWRSAWAIPGRGTISVREHAAVMAAIREGDAAGAAEGMRDHLVHSRELLHRHQQVKLEGASKQAGSGKRTRPVERAGSGTRARSR